MNKVVAIGAGRMGRGIAQVFAFAGHKVSIIDFKDRTSEQTKYLFKESREEIFQNLTLLSSIGLISPELIDSTMDRIELHALSNSKDITLSIDINLQQSVKNNLLETINFYKAESGLAIVMDISNGEVLSSVSLPDFCLLYTSPSPRDATLARIAACA